MNDDKCIEEALFILYKTVLEHTKEEALKQFREDYCKFQKDIATAMSRINKDIEDDSYKNCPYYKEDNTNGTNP